MNSLDQDQEIAVILARDRLTRQVLGATTLSEVADATQALRAWIAAHPEEAGMSDAFEQLAMMQEAAEWQEQERLGQPGGSARVTEAVG